MYANHNKCRACSGADLTCVADFGLRPLANDFKRYGDDHAGFAPLKVLLCERCKLAQLSVVVDPRILYKDYPYVTSNTDTMQKHFEIIYRQIIEHFKGVPSSILEIGSNDGTCLRFFRDKGIKLVMGIEPDKDLATQACNNGIPTTVAFWPHFFSDVKYDVIMARHVFCHVDDWHGFINRASQLMKEDSILWIEAPYVQSLLDSIQVDTIYHEHLSYLNLESISCLLDGSDLILSDVLHYNLHGGCVGLAIRKRDHHPAFKCPDEGLTKERWRNCVSASELTTENLISKCRYLVGGGATICGYGASAKSSFWVQSCGFTKKQIKFICDDTKRKQNCVSPGTDIPIVAEEMLIEQQPNYAICFAWNFMDEIKRRQAAYIGKGGKFIVPIPKVEII